MWGEQSLESSFNILSLQNDYQIYKMEFTKGYINYNSES